MTPGRAAGTSEPEPFDVRLLDAVERIFTTESPSTISMRTIAAEAECSLGVAYNHFDNKLSLIGAALDRMAERITAQAISAGDPAEALPALLDAMSANAAFPRLMTWMVLEGHDVSSAMSGHPLMQRMAKLAADRGAEDPTTVAMTMGLLAIGTFTFGAMLNGAVGREPDDVRLRQAAVDMYADWFPRDEEDA
jgi:AcrR family transcriptional regulator